MSLFIVFLALCIREVKAPVHAVNVVISIFHALKLIRLRYSTDGVLFSQELLTARQEGEEKAMELEHVHADCMLLEDQLLLKDQVRHCDGR